MQIIKRRIQFFCCADDVKGVDLKNSIAIVCDVLRASSTIITALENGCLRIIPVEKVEQAFERAKGYNKNGILIGGERRGRPVDGFELGNSPSQYKRTVVQNKTVIFTTTNGTKALHFAHSAQDVLVLAFLNMSAIFRYIINKESDINIIAAGANGDNSLEDSVCCGLLIHKLLKNNQFLLNDLTEETYSNSKKYFTNISDLLHKSRHGKYLKKIGYEGDLNFCSHVDSSDVVPIFRNGYIDVLKTSNIL